MEIKFSVDITMSKETAESFALAVMANQGVTGGFSPEEVARRTLAEYIQAVVRAYLQERGPVSVMVTEVEGEGG